MGRYIDATGDAAGWLSRALKGTTFKARLTLQDDGELVNAADTVTVAVTKLNGDSHSSGNAWIVSTGLYEFEVASADVELLTLTWSGAIGANSFTARTSVEFVGGLYFSISDLQALADMSSVSDDRCAELRTMVEAAIENFTRRSWVERIEKRTIDTDSVRSDGFWLPGPTLPVREIVSAKLDGSNHSITGWKVDSHGRVRYTTAPAGTTTTGQDLEVVYRVGDDFLPPDLARVAPKIARHWELDDQSHIPDRARMMVNEWGTFHLWSPNDEHPTGLPEIDSTLRQYRRSKLTFA